MAPATEAIVDHANYDIFDIKAIGDNVNYDILKIGAVGYHDKNDIFEKYFSKSLYFTLYLTHWIFRVSNMSYFTVYLTHGRMAPDTRR